MKDRYFLIKDLDCTIIVEFATRKEMLSLIDGYIENIEKQEDDDVFYILYKDGTTVRVDPEFEGKIKKIHIASIVWSNTCTSVVYGNFEVDNEGIVSPAFEGKIATENIEEVAEYKEIKPTIIETVEEKQEEETIEINGQKLNIKRLNNIKKSTNLKLQHFTTKLINDNKELSIKTVKKIIANILKEIPLNETKFYYIKLNKNWTGEVKSNNGFNDWLDFFEYDSKGNVNFTLDDSILLK